MSQNAYSNPEKSQPGSSSDSDLDDLDLLNFPGDIDWSSTLVLRCDPNGGPYNLTDVVTAFNNVVRRNEVFNLGPTVLNHAFTLSFKSNNAVENFVRFLKSPKMAKGVKVKGHHCTVTRVPSKCVTLCVRWIPLEVDTAHIVEELKKYGSLVKTEWVRSNFQGWFHVYTNERRFTLHLKKGVTLDDLPFGIEVKGLFGAVQVAERNPKCLECYYNGHKSDSCSSEKCLLYHGKK